MAVLNEVAKRRTLTSLDDSGIHDGKVLKASMSLSMAILKDVSNQLRYPRLCGRNRCCNAPKSS